LLAEGVGEEEGVAREARRRGEVEVVKPPIFDGMSSKIAGFITACKLYMRMRMREKLVEGQIQWILSYIQRGVPDMWKENVMKELESGKLEYESTEEF